MESLVGWGGFDFRFLNQQFPNFVDTGPFRQSFRRKKIEMRKIEGGG